MNWREKKREAGHRDMLVWLTPDAVTALAALQADNPKGTVAEIVNAAIVQAAKSGLALDGKAVPSDALTKVNDALTDLTARVARIEAGNMPPAEKTPRTKAKGLPPGATKPARVNGADLPAIAKAVEERRALQGDAFKRSDLYRELQAAGVKVHASVSSFCDAVKKIIERGPARA